MVSWRPVARRLVVNRSQQILQVWNQQFLGGKWELTKRYVISTGMKGLATPAGFYWIKDKVVDPSYTYPFSDWVPVDLRGVTFGPGDPNNPLVARWMGLASADPDIEPFIEGVGIHGTRASDLLGTKASHGCIRMGRDDVIQLFNRVGRGTNVFIT